MTFYQHPVIKSPCRLPPFPGTRADVGGAVLRFRKTAKIVIEKNKQKSGKVIQKWCCRVPEWLPNGVMMCSFTQHAHFYEINAPLQRNRWFCPSGRSRRHSKSMMKTARRRGEAKEPYLFGKMLKKEKLGVPFQTPRGTKWSLQDHENLVNTDVFANDHLKNLVNTDVIAFRK